MFIVTTDRWTVYFRGWRPRIVRTWRSGVETAMLKGNAEQQVEELKARLRYQGVVNNITRIDPPKKTRKKKAK